MISDQFSDSHIVTERTNLHSEKISSSDNSEQDIKIETLIPKTETLLQQSHGLESIRNVVISEQEVAAEKTIDENV